MLMIKIYYIDGFEEIADCTRTGLHYFINNNNVVKIVDRFTGEIIYKKGA